MKKNIIFDEKVRGAVQGGAIGDALGLPGEKMTREQIITSFGGIDSYIPAKNNCFIQKAVTNKVKLNFDPEDSGIISDDTIFTMAGMRSITDTKKIELQSLFDAHKILFDRYGGELFGGMTKEKFEQYQVGGDISLLYKKARSNGVMMKQFPYAAYFHAIQKKYDYPEAGFFIDNTMAEITKATHDTPIAKLTAIFHNKVLLTLLDIQPEDLDIGKILKHLHTISPYRENMVGIDETSSTYDPDSDMRITPILDKLLLQRSSIQAGKPYTLEQILETYLVTLDEKKAPGINKKMKPGFHVGSTFGLVYGCFIQNQNWQGLLDAVNIGYDTDSQGAIIGNMIGALHGPFYDKKYVDGLGDKNYLNETLDSFCTTLSSPDLAI